MRHCVMVLSLILKKRLKVVEAWSVDLDSEGGTMPPPSLGRTDASFFFFSFFCGGKGGYAGRRDSLSLLYK